VTRLSLRGLRDGEVAELLAGRGLPDPALAGELRRRTEGNPFFLVELIELLRSERRLDARPGAADIPDSVRDVLERRPRPPPEDTRALLTLAAVVGREFPLDVLEGAAQLDPRADRGAAGARRDHRGGGPRRARAGFGGSATTWCGRRSSRVLTRSAAGAPAPPDRPRAGGAARRGPARRAGPPLLPGRDRSPGGHGRCGTPSPRPPRRGSGSPSPPPPSTSPARWTWWTAPTRPARRSCSWRWGATAGRGATSWGRRPPLSRALDLALQRGDTDGAAEAAGVFGGVALWNWRPYGTSDDVLVARLDELIAATDAGRAHDGPAELLGTLACELCYTRAPRGDGRGPGGCGHRAAPGRRAAPGSRPQQRLPRRLGAARGGRAAGGPRRGARAARTAGPHRGRRAAAPRRARSAVRRGGPGAGRPRPGPAARHRLGLAELRAQVAYQEAGHAMLRGEWDLAEKHAEQAQGHPAAHQPLGERAGAGSCSS
jgi:hypothetical protein